MTEPTKKLALSDARKAEPRVRVSAWDHPSISIETANKIRLWLSKIASHFSVQVNAR
jgi:hypothetical protein